ncbi:hypothetical protein [Tropicimonas sp. IMCC6043]|uniref:hypothetical protein n=1 Tax=Tropicimonas sp. IMCC6043 TaxID=2510645 RepID=UPI00101C00BC|nr:hypothetical protein [Tropicimonas sp. IMCC6043]RYH07074.1 hypothetical protein EU800_21465 [Tropicimonas sp. IMCC6043]
MFRSLLSNSGQSRPEADGAPRRWGLSALRQAYDDWRLGRDIAAIMAAFDRLSNRQLELIGVSRGSLYDTVEDMILAAERERTFGEEVVALLEAPVEARAEAQKMLSFEPELTTDKKDLQVA